MLEKSDILHSARTKLSVIEFPEELKKEYPTAVNGKAYETFLFTDLIIFTEPYYKVRTRKFTPFCLTIVS